MQRLSINLVAILIVGGIVCTSFTMGRKKIPLQKDPSTIKGQRFTQYYFYRFPGDTYDTIQDPISEANRLEIIYQVAVDNSPAGGTLLAKGFNNNDFPHDTFAAVALYGHF